MGKASPDLEPLQYGSMQDTGFKRVEDYYHQNGRRTAVALLSRKSGLLSEGYEVAWHPESGREVRVVFEAGAIQEENVLLLVPRQLAKPL